MSSTISRNLFEWNECSFGNDNLVCVINWLNMAHSIICWMWIERKLLLNEGKWSSSNRLVQLICFGWVIMPNYLPFWRLDYWEIKCMWWLVVLWSRQRIILPLFLKFERIISWDFHANWLLVGSFNCLYESFEFMPNDL